MDPVTNRLNELVELSYSLTTQELKRDDFDSLEILRLAGYVLGAVAAGRELAEGVQRETGAGAPANALRLARHLFELDIELHYVTESPARRFEQLLAREARNRLSIAKHDAEGAFEDPEFHKELKRLAGEGHRAEGKATKRKEAGEDVPADDLGWPGYDDKAKALERLHDYNVLYLPASWLAHPGFEASEIHLTGGDGNVKVRASGSKPELAESALALAVVSFYRVIHSANGHLGPFANVNETLEEIGKRPCLNTE